MESQPKYYNHCFYFLLRGKIQIRSEISPLNEWVKGPDNREDLLLRHLSRIIYDLSTYELVIGAAVPAVRSGSHARVLVHPLQSYL